MNYKIGIRREDKSKWEKRAPLTPQDVIYLKENESIETVIQPSEIRIFKDKEYEKIGAEISEKIDAPFIVGIKEIPPDFFEKDKTYIFFSHTIKGQKYNMDMLKKMMNMCNTLIDYECIRNRKGERLIAFGKHAGIAGMIEALWATGKRLELEGFQTVLSHIKRPLEYSSLIELKKEAEKLGDEIRNEGFPEFLAPFVIGITGYGRVSQGAQELLKFFPVEEITPSKLFTLKDNPHTIYKVIFKEEHIVMRKDGTEFELQDYYDNPEKYYSVFHEYLPYLRILVNAIYWEDKYPRLVTEKCIKEIFNRNDNKLRIIADISCDIKGSIECTHKACTPDNPVYVYNCNNGKIEYGIKGEGPVIMAVDILPSEIPYESSVYFSDILKEFISDIVKATYPSDFEKCSLPESIKDAVILYKGKLTPKYKYLKEYVEED